MPEAPPPSSEIAAPAILVSADLLMLRLRQVLERSDNLAELDQGARELDALRYMAKKARVELHYANAIIALRFRLIRKIGAILAANLTQGRPRETVLGGNTFPTLEELGFTRKFSMESQEIARIREDLFEAYIALGQLAGDEIELAEGEPQYKHPVELTRRGLLDYAMWTRGNEEAAQREADRDAKIVADAERAVRKETNRPTVWREDEPLEGDAKIGDLWVTAAYLPAADGRQAIGCAIDSPRAEQWYVWRYDRTDDDDDWMQVETCESLADAEAVVARLLGAEPEPAAPAAPEYPPDEPTPPPPIPPARPAVKGDQIKKALRMAVHPTTPEHEAAAALNVVRNADPNLESLDADTSALDWEYTRSLIERSNGWSNRAQTMQEQRDEARRELDKANERLTALQTKYRAQTRIIAEQNQEIERLRAILRGAGIADRNEPEQQAGTVH